MSKKLRVFGERYRSVEEIERRHPKRSIRLPIDYLNSVAASEFLADHIGSKNYVELDGGVLLFRKRRFADRFREYASFVDEATGADSPRSLFAADLVEQARHDVVRAVIDSVGGTSAVEFEQSGTGHELYLTRLGIRFRVAFDHAPVVVAVRAAESV